MEKKLFISCTDERGIVRKKSVTIKSIRNIRGIKFFLHKDMKFFDAPKKSSLHYMLENQKWRISEFSSGVFFIAERTMEDAWFKCELVIKEKGIKNIKKKIKEITDMYGVLNDE